MNGLCNGCVAPSTETCRSSMDSSRADWVLGEARLISSPTTMLAKIPPGLNSKSRVCWLNTDTPVTSLGSRSGVNWIRRTVQAIDRPNALANIVLPTPGTSSSNRCPSANSTTMAMSMAPRLPSITPSMAVRTLPITSSTSASDRFVSTLLLLRPSPPRSRVRQRPPYGTDAALLNLPPGAGITGSATPEGG